MNAEYVERQLENSVLTAREKCLISLSFGGDAADGAFRTLTDGLDLDTANQNYLLMLSCLGFTKGWDRFPPEMVPRLKGIHRYHQAHISMGIPWLVRQLRTLTDEGIPVMLLKGVAMLACYAPGRPRIMYDYDLAVPEGQFDRALELLLYNGNRLGWKAMHSTALSGERDHLDLHRWIFKLHNDQFSDVWKRAESFHFYGVDVRVPAQEDMFVHLLDTQSLNYIWDESPTRRLQWLYDCRDVWAYSEGLKLERLAARAQELHNAPRIRMMLRLFMRCFPGLIEPEEFERYFPRTPECDRLLAQSKKVKDAFARYRSYGYSEQSAMTPAHIWRGLRVELIHYRYLKPELQRVGPNMSFFRFLKDRYSIDGFSHLAKGYLSRIRLFEKRNRGD